MHSQNNEANIVLMYFNGRTGCVLDIGANDGETFSNSRDLILHGWNAFLVEPSHNAFLKLDKLYNGNKKVSLFNWGIGKEHGWVKFYESGAHVPNGKDIALVSTAIESEMQRWQGVEFHPIEAFIQRWEFVPWNTTQFKFISIDAEGCDWDILQQIDLKAVGCECLCIEWNSKPGLLQAYTTYVQQFGMKRIGLNAENVIFAI